MQGRPRPYLTLITRARPYGPPPQGSRTPKKIKVPAVCVCISGDRFAYLDMQLGGKLLGVAVRRDHDETDLHVMRV